MALGMTTAAVVSPATMSGRNHSARYCDNQSSSGRRKLIGAAFAAGPSCEMGLRANPGYAALISTSAAQGFARRLAGPAPVCMRERAGFLVSQQPGHLGNRQALVQQVAARELQSQAVHEPREGQPF